jgi:hypothetical protein
MQHLEIIDKIAAKLAAPTEMIVQAYAAHGVAAGVSLIFSTVLLILSIICFIVAIRWIRDGSDYADLGISLGTVGVIGIVTFSIVSALAALDFVFWLTDPQAYAVYTLVEKVLK